MRSKVLLTVLLGISLPAAVAGPPAAPDGHFEGAIAIMGAELGIRVDFRTGPQGLAATIDIPQQGAAGLPLSAVRFDPPKIHFELPAGPGLATFDGEVKGDGITGAFAQAGATGTFHLEKGSPAPVAASKAEPVPYREDDVRFKSEDGEFAGTLTVPPGPGPHPAVVLITGSGPQNRDEEIFGFKPFRLLADHFSRHGIAVLRYDDRGVGGTTASPAQATTEDFARDALAAVAFLKARPGIDPGRIGLLGHSEGGSVAPIAAARSLDVKFIVMVSGMGVSGERILYEQGERLLRAEGASEADLATEAAFQKRIFAAVRTGEGWDTLRADLRQETLAKVAKMPDEERKAIGDPQKYADAFVERQVAMARSPWFKFFLDFDPAKVLVKVRCPVLALFGEKDLQVPAETNRKAVAAALEAGGNKDVTIKVFAGANHLYQAARTGSVSEYATLPKEFVPGFLDTITGWIQARTGTKEPPAKVTGAAVSTAPTPAPPSVAPAPLPPAPEGSPEARAEAFLARLRTGDYEGAQKEFDKTMAEAMPPTALKAAWESLLAQSGALRSVVERRKQVETNHVIVDLICAFERSSLVVRVVYDEAWKIAGFWALPVERAVPS